jgi:hypothetical protein
MLGWQAGGGFSVDASVHVEGHDRAGVERLVRYCARGPLALERLLAMDGQAALASPEARLLYRLAELDLQGRTALLLSPLELLERLARLVPPPRIHRQRYHGVLAPNARLRALVVAIGREEVPSERATEPSPTNDPSDVSGPPPPPAAPDPTRLASAARIRWAQLLARIYDHRINSR